MIIFHIGLPKTGTSAIQYYLNESNVLLKSEGVLYPWPHAYPQDYYTSGGNAARILAVARKGHDLNQIESLKVALEDFSKQYSKIVLSSETLSVFFNNPEDLLKYCPSGQNVKVVLYLRNQIDKMVSDVNQTIKNKGRDNYSLGQNWYEFNDYFSLVGKWERAFGQKNMIVKGFDSSELVNGDIVEDFCYSISIPFLGYDKDQPINPGLNLEHMELMRCVNHEIKLRGGVDMSVRENIKKAVLRRSVESSGKRDNGQKLRKTYIPKRYFDKAIDSFQEGNLLLSSKFGIRSLDLEEAKERYVFAPKPGYMRDAAKLVVDFAVAAG